MKSLKYIFMIALTCMINPGSSFYRAKCFNSVSSTKIIISNNFGNNQLRAKSSIRPAHLAVIRSNPISSIFSPDIYPIFEEAVLFNTAQALILTLVKQKSLTNQGLIHATILGIGLWTFLGFRGWIICVTYLILGSLATKVKMSEKEVKLSLIILPQYRKVTHFLLNRNLESLRSEVEQEALRMSGEVLQP